jgi:hypothetical protein
MKLKCMLCHAETEVPDSPYVPKGWYCFKCMFRAEIERMKVWMYDNGVREYNLKLIEAEEAEA